MATMVKLMTVTCELCRLDYQNAWAYINAQNQVACVDCMDLDIAKVSA